MRREAAWLATVLGLVAITLLVSRLSAEVFAATQTALVLAAGVLVLLAAASLFLVPARRLQRALFLTPARDAAGLFGVASPQEMRAALRPVLAAVAALAVAGAAAALR